MNNVMRFKLWLSERLRFRVRMWLKLWLRMRLELWLSQRARLRMRVRLRIVMRLRLRLGMWLVRVIVLHPTATPMCSGRGVQARLGHGRTLEACCAYHARHTELRWIGSERL